MTWFYACKNLQLNVTRKEVWVVYLNYVIAVGNAVCCLFIEYFLGPAFVCYCVIVVQRIGFLVILLSSLTCLFY
jgi:hypothetical protein